MTHLTTTHRPLVADRRRLARYGAAAACAAALIASGGYGATQTFGPDAYEPSTRFTTAPPTERVVEELRASLAGQYGTAQRAVPAGEPSARQLRQIADGLALQYGGR